LTHACTYPIARLIYTAEPPGSTETSADPAYIQTVAVAEIGRLDTQQSCKCGWLDDRIEVSIGEAQTSEVEGCIGVARPVKVRDDLEM
jgi:hypothetical protein